MQPSEPRFYWFFLASVVVFNIQRPSTHGMVGEYSLVASATVEFPRDLAFMRDSIVADATVKTFHAHRGLMVFEK
jgi:hypothetical protein